MIVRVIVAVFIGVAAQDGVDVGVAVGVGFPAAIDECVRALRGGDGVEHDVEVATGGVFHADRDLDATGGEAVLLVFDGPSADCDVAKDVI